MTKKSVGDNTNGKGARIPNERPDAVIGRPKKDFDFEKIKYDLMCGCSGVALAEEFGVHYDTLYDWVKEKTGMSFSDFSQKMKQKGNDNIHKKQYEIAMQGTKESVSMLIWLGKQRLGQKDKHESNVNLDSKVSVFELMEKDDKKGTDTE